MFRKHVQIAPARITGLLCAAEAAARAIPLDATVAVNPFLGQTGEDLAMASAGISTAVRRCGGPRRSGGLLPHGVSGPSTT